MFGQELFLADLGNVVIWASAVIPLIFMIQYTILAKWWKNWFGRTIIGLDFCLFVVFFFSVIRLVDPGWAFTQTITYRWIVTLAIAGVSIIAFSRIVLWEVLRRKRKLIRMHKKMEED